MATRSGNVIQDQNLNIHPAGDPPGKKLNVSRISNKGGLTGRKALKDISNSKKPSALERARKANPKNVLSIKPDNGASRSFSVLGDKASTSEGFRKAQTSGRKPLGDLTNSLKPCVQPLPKKFQEKSSGAIVVETIPRTIKEEKFLQNHSECIKSDRKAVNFGHFLETVGLSKGSSLNHPLPSKLKDSQFTSEFRFVYSALIAFGFKFVYMRTWLMFIQAESPLKSLEMMEEVRVLLKENRSEKAEYPLYSSPSRGTPKSALSTNEKWKDCETTDFEFIESPKLQKHLPLD